MKNMVLQMEPSAQIPRGEADYENPYMVEDKDDILARLRRDTTNDRRNKKNYKREVLSLNGIMQMMQRCKPLAGWEISV